MPVLKFDHFNIRAPRELLDEVKTFYEEVVGLKVGPRPNFPFFGYWLYVENQPILHLMDWGEAPQNDEPSARFLDHVAFACEDLDGFIQKLEGLKVNFSSRSFDLPTGGKLTQLNITDPCGTGVELNFTQL